MEQLRLTQGSTMSVSVTEVQSLAESLGIRIERLAPSWRWFSRKPDGKPQLFVMNNLTAYDELLRVKKQTAGVLWHIGFELKLDPKRDAQIQALFPTAYFIWARADTKASVIHALNETLSTGQGTGQPSCAHWISKKWKTVLPLDMQILSKGIWIRTASGIELLADL